MVAYWQHAWQGPALGAAATWLGQARNPAFPFPLIPVQVRCRPARGNREVRNTGSLRSQVASDSESESPAAACESCGWSRDSNRSSRGGLACSWCAEGNPRRFPIRPVPGEAAYVESRALVIGKPPGTRRESPFPPSHSGSDSAGNRKTGNPRFPIRPQTVPNRARPAGRGGVLGTSVRL